MTRVSFYGLGRVVDEAVQSRFVCPSLEATMLLWLWTTLILTSSWDAAVFWRSRLCIHCLVADKLILRAHENIHIGNPIDQIILYGPSPYPGCSLSNTGRGFKTLKPRRRVISFEARFS